MFTLSFLIITPDAFSNILLWLKVELAEVTEIKDPDSLSPTQRQVLQEETENDKFSEDHYFQDLMVTDISAILEYKLDLSEFKELKDSDRDQLKNFVNQEFLLDKTEHMQLFLGVVDIIFAFLYNLRINQGKNCVESQWNVSRLSSTLSSFQVSLAISQLHSIPSIQLGLG